MARGDKYLGSKANLESDADDKEKANTIRNIKKHNVGINTIGISNFTQKHEYQHKKLTKMQIPMSWNTMEEYEEEDECQ